MPDTGAVQAGPAPRVSLVLPAFNEEARLPSTLGALAAYLQRTGLRCEVLVVDNASSDNTTRVAQDAREHFEELRVLRTPRRGKGVAVRTGVLAAVGHVIFYADADLSWSLDDLPPFMALVEGGSPVVIGSREGTGAHRLSEPPYRHAMGRVFNRLVQAVALPGLEDTQCGFKAFSREAARSIFQRQVLSGFGFDVEVLYLARRLGFAVHSVPIRWEHRERSRVQPVRDTLRMASDVVRVRWNDFRGVYALTEDEVVLSAT